jgi:ethanolamine utilization protein EutQ
MKRLITAAVVRQECRAGAKRLEVRVPDCIVTPEARTVAGQLGLDLVETIGLPAKRAHGPVEPDAPAGSDLAAIRSAVMARIAKGSVPAEIIDQMIEKAVKERPAADSSPAAPDASTGSRPSGLGGYAAQTAKPGVKRIAGSSVKMRLFEGAGEENRVGCVDVVTAEDGSSMGAGFMEWENCFFPWTLKYDEVDYIVEGELHIRCNGNTTIGKAGDVIFIPKNSSIEFGTPSKVRFLFIAHPANWAKQ